MEQVAERIAPRGRRQGGLTALDADDAYTLHGTDALQTWMQERPDEVVTALASTYCDVPDPVRRSNA